MEKPYKYQIFDTITKTWEYTNIEPLLHHLETYVPTQGKNVSVKKQTKICYIDTRYEAKKRLFEYLHPEQKKRPYEPFKGTEIGKSLPILNF